MKQEPVPVFVAEGMNRERMVKTSLYKCILKDRADIAGSDRLRSYSPAMALEHEVITGERGTRGNRGTGTCFTEKLSQ